MGQISSIGHGTLSLAQPTEVISALAHERADHAAPRCVAQFPSGSWRRGFWLSCIHFRQVMAGTARRAAAYWMLTARR